MAKFLVTALLFTSVLHAGDTGKPSLGEKVKGSLGGLRKILARMRPDSERHEALSAALAELEQEILHPSLAGKQVKRDVASAKEAPGRIREKLSKVKELLAKVEAHAKEDAKVAVKPFALVKQVKAQVAVIQKHLDEQHDEIEKLADEAFTEGEPPRDVKDSDR